MLSYTVTINPHKQKTFRLFLEKQNIFSSKIVKSTNRFAIIEFEFLDESIRKELEEKMEKLRGKIIFMIYFPNHKDRFNKDFQSVARN